MTKSEFSSGTQAVDRASALLISILGATDPPLLGELARAHNLAKSTTSRLLTALERQGLIQRDRNGAFFAGHILTSFAHEQSQDSVLVARMRPVLEVLAQKTGETANLAVRGNGFVNLIDQVDGHYLLGATNWIGKQVPYHASALGKILLAYSVVPLPTGRLERRTAMTITSKAALLKELAKVRRVGYAIIVDELEAGLVAISAPIRELDGRVIGAISISGPSPRLNRTNIQKVAKVITSEIEAEQNKTLRSTTANRTSSIKTSPNKTSLPKLRKVGAA